MAGDGLALPEEIHLQIDTSTSGSELTPVNSISKENLLKHDRASGSGLGSIERNDEPTFYGITRHSFHKWRLSVLKTTMMWPVQLFMGILLFVSLFLTDIWLLENVSDDKDDIMNAIMIAIFVIFMLEWILLCVVQDGYVISVFSLLDLIGTLSILLDIGWISEPMFPSDGTISSQQSVIRAARVVKLSTRYGRLLRTVRLFAITKLLPFLSSRTAIDYEPTLTAIKRVSAELSDSLGAKSAILVLALVIIMPFMVFQTNDYSPESWITNFKIQLKDSSTTVDDLSEMARKCHNFYVPKLGALRELYMESPYLQEPFFQEYDTNEVVRDHNVARYDSKYSVDYDAVISSGSTAALDVWNQMVQNGQVDSDGNPEFIVRLEVDETAANQELAMLNMITIAVMIVLLFTFTMSFNHSVNSMVVRPLELMMTTLRSSAMLMLNTLRGLDSVTEGGSGSKSVELKKSIVTSMEEDDELETEILEKLVEKLVRILQHALPSSDQLSMNNTSIDKTTASWLKESYTSGAGGILNRRTTCSMMAVDETTENLVELVNRLPSNVVSELDTWNFDVMKHSEENLHLTVLYLFHRLNLLEQFQVSDALFLSFLSEVSSRYVSSNSYHNYRHGVDVCFTTYRLLVVPQLTDIFSELEVYATLVGALAHDIGHPGVNNLFLVKSKHELALQHNDRSPLENMHCVQLYEVMAQQQCNIFHAMGDKQWRDARKVILTIILGTDMSHHFEQISKSQLFLEVNGEDTAAYCSGMKDTMDCMRDEKNRMFMLELVLHCSDISNPFKPFELCRQWADLVVEEFCVQGDQEKALGLEVSPMCDRDSIVLCNMQMGFIEFVVAPLVVAFVKILPPLHEVGTNMLNNFVSWGDLRRLEIATDSSVTDTTEELAKLDERMIKFKEKMNFLPSLQSTPQRKRPSIDYGVLDR